MKIVETKIRVRYRDVDCMRIAYYSRYFEWFEIARTEFLRQFGYSYDAT